MAIFRRWLGLTLAGLLAYALLRALWAIIVLGTPLADWQWYVPFSVCLILLPSDPGGPRAARLGFLVGARVPFHHIASLRL